MFYVSVIMAVKVPCTSSCNSISELLFLLTVLGSRLLLSLVSVSESCSVSSWYWKKHKT